MTKVFKLGVIGCGNMATAILKGIVDNNIIMPKDIIISDTDTEKLNIIKNLGVNTAYDNNEVVKNSEILMLAIKPQILREKFIINQLKKSDNDIVVSILAGVTISELKYVLGHKRICRVMPNLPLMTGNGTSALCFTDKKSRHYDIILHIFKSLGLAIEIDECQFDAVTSISGSGPAYVFYFINSLIKAGVEGGLTYAQAKMLAINTIIGSSEMVLNSTKAIENLISDVCSKGGTTIEAINHFNDNNMEDIIIQGVNKCRNRSYELSRYEKG